MTSNADFDWDGLIRQIKQEHCTPILGRGAYLGEPVNGGNPAGGDPAGPLPQFVYPLNDASFEKWAKDITFPLGKPLTMESLASYEAIKRKNKDSPKYRIKELFEKTAAPNFHKYQTHRVLAFIPFPFYVTTSFDNFLLEALKKERKNPTKAVFKWWRKPESHEAGEPDELIPYLKVPVKFHPATPLVYYFYGITEFPRTLALTEDDYFELLLNAIGPQDRIPKSLRWKLGGLNSLLFLGYRVNDWDFKALFRTLTSVMRKEQPHFALQVPPNQPASTIEEVTTYLEAYFDRSFNLQVYWGTCEEFLKMLREKWEAQPD